MHTSAKPGEDRRKSFKDEHFNSKGNWRSKKGIKGWSK